MNQIDEVSQNVVNQYYKKIITRDINNHDMCLLQFTNNIIVVTLSLSHPFLISKENISKIDFQTSKNVNRLVNNVSGKGKKGAQYLKKNSLLCTVFSETGKKYELYPACEGKLIEINEKLTDNPNILIKKPQSEGFLAIILPKLDYRISVDI